jgi:glycosyltransferase involved in cell wall biosynthesis
MQSGRRKIMFLYLGRRGVLGQLALELAREVVNFDDVEAVFALSRQNEHIEGFRWLGDRLLPVDTFNSVLSPDHPLKFWKARRLLLERIAKDQIDSVITLMPHIWTPLLAPAIRARGASYTTIIHDAVGHPGDPTAWATPWLKTEARKADHVVTLSRSVAVALAEAGSAPLDRIATLLLPDLKYGGIAQPRRRDFGREFRILFLGRIMKYKGLPLLVEAVEKLREQGVSVHLGVAGSGELGPLRARLEALGAEIINRWFEDAELTHLLERYDALALPYIEASQSGVAAVAFGSCMPVVAMPSGGLEDQVMDGKTGVLATSIESGAFARAIERLASAPGLYETISANLFEQSEVRSMKFFARKLVGISL